MDDQLAKTMGVVRGLALLEALNAAAASIQHSARSEADVIRAFHKQVLALGLRGGLSLLDETGEQATIRIVALPDDLKPMLGEIEEVFGQSLGDFTFPLTDVEVYRDVVQDRRPSYVAESVTVIRQMVPAQGMKAAEKLIQQFGQTPAIFAPLIINGKVSGVVNIAGEELFPEDIPAFEAFANHIGIALENAALISASRRSEQRYRRLAERLLVVREIDQAILAARSKEVIASVVLERLSGLIPFEEASITLFDFEANTGRLLAVHSAGETVPGEESAFKLQGEMEQIKALIQGEIFQESKTIDSEALPVPGQETQSCRMEHIVNIPLITRGDVTGSLNIARTAIYPFEQEHIEIAAEVAGLLAVAIQDSRFLEAELRRRQEAETLIGITADMTSSLKMDTVLENIISHLGRVVPYDSACIFMVEGDELRVVADQGFPDIDDVTSKTYTIDDELAKQILDSGKVVILEDAQTHPAFHRWGGTGYTRGWMGVPLSVKDQTIGLMTLDSCRFAAYGPAQAELAQAVANQAAITIENARLFAETERLLSRTRKHAAQLSQIMDLVPDGIVLLDVDRQVVVANKAAAAYLAQLSDVCIGDRLDQLGHVPTDRLLQANAAKSWQEISAVGSGTIYEVSARPLDQSTEKSDWLLILRNVTDTRRQEGYLRTQERLVTVGQLAAGIAHDFNNIMTVISLYTQLVLRMPNLPPKEEQRLNTIQLQAQRASQLIRQILDFSRQSMVDRKPVDLLSFMRELARTLEQSLPTNMELETDFAEGDYLINADTARLRQAVMNLTANSRDAMPGGGKMSIRLDTLTLKADQSFPLPDMTAGDWIMLQFSDTGSGIPENVLPRVFEPFFTTKPAGESTGLGLAQVYGIVKLHDGFIDVASPIGQGAIFTIYFPAFSAPLEEDSDLELPFRLAGNGETLLIVEDDHPSREALVEIMETLNYHVLPASNGVEALEIFQAQKGAVDLVISDMVMPVMDGAALYNKLKEKWPGIKMIVVTGYPLDQSGKELLNQGIVAYIQKPLRVEVVAQAVRDALSSDS